MDHRNHPLVIAADAFAERAHAGQVRKYTGEPYVEHPREVMNLVAEAEHTPERLAAALLHDVVEDTDVTMFDIIAKFGPVVGLMVSDLTDISKPEHGNRAVRKTIDRVHTASACPGAKTIKLADLISNTRSIIEYDPGFARVYMVEKRELLKVLTEGDAGLYARASRIVDTYFDCMAASGESHDGLG